MRLSANLTIHALIDAAGQEHAPSGENALVVSLVPSLTELLFALGLGAQVVGRTTYCVHPAERVRPIPAVGGTKTVDIEEIRRLRPSHVLVNVDETPKAIADAVAALGVRVVVTHPIRVDDNVDLYRLLSGLFGRPAEAAALTERYRAARAKLDAKASRWPDRHAHKTRLINGEMLSWYGAKAIEGLAPLAGFAGVRTATDFTKTPEHSKMPTGRKRQAGRI